MELEGASCKQTNVFFIRKKQNQKDLLKFSEIHNILYVQLRGSGVTRTFFKVRKERRRSEQINQIVAMDDTIIVLRNPAQIQKWVRIWPLVIKATKKNGVVFGVFGVQMLFYNVVKGMAETSVR